MRWKVPTIPQALRSRLGVVVVCAVGLTLGYWLVPRSDPVDDPSVKPPAILLYDEPLPAGPEAEQEALRRVRERVRGWFELVLPAGKIERLTYAELGARIDKSRLRQLVRDARDSTSPLRRTRRRLGATEPLVLPAPITLATDKVLDVLLRFKHDVDRKPSDARLDLEKKSVVPERQGWLLDVDGSLGEIQRSLAAGERRAALAVQELKPARTAAQLARVDYSQLLGFFETNYDRAERSAARTFNLRLAASRLDGYVLMPGEEFDFNDVVGARDEANGYQIAPVIAQGEVVDGIGGGTCQVSGTLHGAAFFAGLEIVERHPHTRPSSYIKMGMDATVVYPTINFRLKNAYDFPIVLRETVTGGVVRAEVRGPEPAVTTTLIRRVVDATPYEEVQRPDGRLPDGERVLAQRGVPGFKVRRYRIVRRGDHAVRESWTDTYPPTSQVVLVGAGTDSEAKPPRGDSHPEYVADELLVMTSRAGDDGAPEFVTRRKKGKFGERGWTEEAGMPVFRRR